jgi:sec-independent protein translocase protein TatC
VTIPTDDPHAAPSTADHGTNGTNGAVTPGSGDAGLGASGSSGTTVQASSSTTDASSTPALYEPASAGPPSIPPPNGTGSMEPYGDAPEDEEEGMTMLEHLEELRDRLIVCSVALVAGLIVAAIPIPWLTRDSVTQTVMNLVAAPAQGHLQYLQPGEGFITYFQLALMVGFVLALPVITYQLIMFVLPALLPHEKKYLYMALPGAMLSFIIGVLFGYILVIPVAINFLLNWNPADIVMMWQFSEYIGTVSTLLLWMGLAFETPLLMFFLTKLRVIDPVRVARFRKYMLILSFVVGAIITPTPDPLNQTIVSLPLYLLFELGLLLSRLA